MTKNQSKNRLTSPEIANLWTQYINDSMAICVLTFLLEKCNDKEIKTILKNSIKLSTSHIDKIKRFLKEENYPIPQGFDLDDVNLNAPPLFSDDLILIYMQVMTLHGMNSYSLCTTTSIRADQREYYSECITETSNLYDSILDVMLNKGLVSHPPIINPPKDIDFISNQNYLTGWFGKKRPLNAIEISGIHYNMVKTMVKVVLEIAFGQVAQSTEVRKYFQRGTKICEKQLKEMSSILADDHLPSPKSWQYEVTSSTEAPFSDKLMLFHVVGLVAVAVGYYGAALSASQRRDIILKYTKLIGEIGLYAEDGVNLLIKNGWMEQPPMVDDREALAKKK
ncbi:DUF3231 family protein [Aquibacillus rhizosphaerae]|uniref:DUF3231 family protein n=1 Tax=Aquibacillus rhizosphaerae TaxID=3051431 RepID=A0ABT7LB97_9BACI|nr:DUF3231 family protein [Aquibacillus sp. LR5S19]MDL4843137.1 DUF3231 family protein [Aquibacillus sp. LR5S19]